MAVRESTSEEVPFLDSEDASSLEEMTIDIDDKTTTTSSVRRFKLPKLPKWKLKSPRWATPRWTTPEFKSEYVQRFFDFLKQFLLFFIPSFWRSSEESEKELHETAYLDGLRGFACYCVFFSHHLTAYCNEVWHSYGEVGGNLQFVQTYYLYQLPIIRLLYNGQAAIGVFFVLSGYVLSYKPLKLMHTHNFDKLQATLASSIFRRWMRLFLPVAALWIINVFLVEFRAYDWFDHFQKKHPGVPPGILEFHLQRGKSFWGTAENARRSFVEYAKYTLVNWTGSGMVPEVDGHVWTLHTEFRSSCILFLFLHGASRMAPNLRLAFFWLSCMVCMWNDEWAIATFLGGSAIADMDLRMRRAAKSKIEENSDFDSLPSQDDSITKYEFLRKPLIQKSLLFVKSYYDQFLWFALYIVGLLVMSFPLTKFEDVPGYRTLNSLHPKGTNIIFWWVSISSLMIVYTAGRSRVVQRILTWRFSQYIGKTSFALYLVHGTAIKTIGHVVVVQCWAHVTGYDGWGYAMGIVLPLVFITGPIVVLVTDWYWRGIDVPSMKFGRWLEGLVKDKTI